MTPVSSHARAVILSGPGWDSTVIDHCRQAHRLIAGSRLACCQVRPSSRDTSTRAMLRPSPAIAHPRMVSGPAGISSSSPGTRMSQLSGSGRQRNTLARRRGVGVGVRRKEPIVEGLEVVLRRDGLHGDGGDPLDAAGPDISGHHHPHRAAVGAGQRLEFICQASSTSSDSALVSGMELP